MGETDRVRATMRAWAIDGYGGLERMRLRKLPVPEPGPRDVLIRMSGAEVGDWDILVREGEWPMGRPFPLVLGLAGAGTVAAIGGEVAGFAKGDSVYAYSYPLYHNGAWAENMLVPASYVAHAPASLDLMRAGGVPIVGLTAHETLTDILAVQRSDVVLITAAAGGVGHLAVQIATRIGARVVATASRRNHDFVRALGAEAVIDYTAEDIVAAVRARYPGGVDKVLNGVSGEAANQVVRTLRQGGRMVDLTGSVSKVPSGVCVDREYVVRADGNRLAQVARRIDDERLTVEVQDLIPFECAPPPSNWFRPNMFAARSCSRSLDGAPPEALSRRLGRRRRKENQVKNNRRPPGHYSPQPARRAGIVPLTKRHLASCIVTVCPPGQPGDRECHPGFGVSSPRLATPSRFRLSGASSRRASCP